MMVFMRFSFKVFVGMTSPFNMHCEERWRCRLADQFVVGRLTMSLVARCQRPKAKSQKPIQKIKKAVKKNLDGFPCIAPSVAFITPAKRSFKQNLLHPSRDYLAGITIKVSDLVCG